MREKSGDIVCADTPHIRGAVVGAKNITREDMLYRTNGHPRFSMFAEVCHVQTRK